MLVLPPRVALQVLEELRVGREDEGGLAIETAVECLHRLQELVEIHVLTVGARVNQSCLGVGRAHEFLRGFVTHGRRGEDVALLLSPDLGRAALPLRAAALRDSLSLRDHSLEDLFLYRLHLVYSLEAHVYQLYPELGRDLGRLFQDLRRYLLPSRR